MGEYYDYVNFDRKERFSIGLVSDGVRRSAVGRTIGARGFELLLLGTTEPTRNAERVGSGMGDRVGVVGDQIIESGVLAIESAFQEDADQADSDRTLSSLVHEECRDLASAVLVMLVRHDEPGRYAERARESDVLFVAFAEIVHKYDQADIRHMLETHFDDWQARHSRLVKERWVDVPPP